MRLKSYKISLMISGITKTMCIKANWTTLSRKSNTICPRCRVPTEKTVIWVRVKTIWRSCVLRVCICFFRNWIKRRRWRTTAANFKQFWTTSTMWLRIFTRRSKTSKISTWNCNTKNACRIFRLKIKKSALKFSPKRLIFWRMSCKHCKQKTKHPQIS